MIPLTLCLFSFSCGLCGSSSDEEQIRQLIDRAVELAERHDVGGLEDLATGDVTIHPGGLRRSDLKRWLFLAFRRYGQFSLLYPRPVIELDEQAGSARTSLYFLMIGAGQAPSGLADLRDRPEEWLERAMSSTHLFKLNLELTRQDGDWLVSGARFQRLKGLGFP